MPAFADYAALTAAVSTHAGGSSDTAFAAAIDEAVALAESELNTRLRVPEMIVRGLATLDEEWEGLPSDFLEMRQVYLVDTDGLEKPLHAASAEKIGWYTRYRGEPKAYAIIGRQLKIEPRVEGTDYSIRLVYYAKVPELATASCTVLLERYPLLYLYGTLSNLYGWLVGDPRVPGWRGAFEQQIETANRALGGRVRGYAA